MSDHGIIEYQAKKSLIYSRMSAIMDEMDAIGKNRTNQQQGFGFKFRGIDDVYNELHYLLAKHKVFTMPEVLSSERHEKPTKSGGLMTYTISRIRYRFYTEDGTFVDAIVIGEGSDSGDKSSNKSMAIGHKYALLQAFCIPTEDKKDPDEESHENADRITPLQVDQIRTLAIKKGVNNAIKWGALSKKPSQELGRHEFQQIWNALESMPNEGDFNGS